MSFGVSGGIEDVLNDAVASGAIPGAVFSIAHADGETEQMAVGKLRTDSHEPVTTATMFRLMSMTKALASVGALQLVEQGKLELEQEVASVLPLWSELKVLEGFDGDLPRLRKPSRPATIRHLMTHTAGHGYAFINADLHRYHQVTGAPDPFSGLKAYLQTPLIADPGAAWNYGINTDWLGQVIEAVSGQDLASYLDEHVLAPLGMFDTTFSPSPEQRSRLMAIHARTPDGGLTVLDLEAPLTNPEFWPAGHGAYGTGGDYARFMAALLGGGELDGARILRAESVELMFTDYLGGIALPELMATTMPELSNDVPRAPFTAGWGLGLHLFTEDLPGMRRAGSGDWAGLMNCYFWIDPSSGVAAAFLTQVLPFFDARAVETAVAVEQELYAEVASPT